MGHSKDLGLLAGHSKDIADPGTGAEIVRAVIEAWGPVTTPALLRTPLPALIAQAVAALTGLADAGALTLDESSELQGRIQALTVLASAPDEPAEPAEPAGRTPGSPVAPEGSLADVLAATLPDPSLGGAWDVAATALAATAAVIGQAVSAPEGGRLGAAAVVSAWPDWVAAATA
jgi:hypothetical protein